MLRKTSNYYEFDDYKLYQINFNIGKNTSCTYSKDMIVDTKTCKIATNILKIYNINIDKCYKFWYNEEKKDNISKVIKWGALFNATTIDELKEIMKGGLLMFNSKEELLKEIKKKNGMFTLENLWDYEAEDIRIKNTLKEYGYRKGMKQGILQNQKQIILNMLNNDYSYDEISKITGINKDKIAKLI